MTAPSLRSDFVWTLGGNVIYLACQWAIVIVIAKASDPTTLGHFTLAIAICSPIVMIAGLALRVVQSNDTTERRHFGVYLGLRVWGTAAALALIAVIGAAGIGMRQTNLVVVIYGVAKAIEAISEIFWGELHRAGAMRAIATSMIIKGLGSVLVFSVLLMVTHALAVATAGIAVAWFITLLAYDIPVARRRTRGSLRPVFRTPELVELARTAWPLGIVMMLISITAHVPRYFLVSSHGEHEVGLFSAIANFMVIGLSVVMALGQAIAPRLARCANQSDYRGFRSLVRVLLLVASGLSVAGVAVAALFGGLVLRIAYTPEYVKYADLLTLLMVACVPAYFLSVFGVIVNAVGMFRPQVPLQLVNLAIVIAGCALGIPALGAKGAGVAILVANGVVMVAGGLVVVHAMRTVRRTT